MKAAAEWTHPNGHTINVSVNIPTARLSLIKHELENAIFNDPRNDNPPISKRDIGDEMDVDLDFDHVVWDLPN